jgi:uncharacterized membrane protein
VSLLGQFHLAVSLVALATGAFVLVRRKGTAQHRRVGWTYAAAMLALNGSALWIYRLTGTFGPLHVAAVISLGTVLAGVWSAWSRKPGDRQWLRRHYSLMSWSYLGLVAAAVAEVATRVPAVQAIAGGPTPAFWITVALASIAVFVFGGRIIIRREKTVLRPFQRA